MKPAAVVALGLGAVVLVFAVLLAHSGERRSGSDLTPNGAFITALGSGQSACQAREPLPADTSAVRMTIGTYHRPGPPLQLTITGADGRLLTSGGLPAGWRQGVVRIPVRHVSHPAQGTQVCVRSAGPQTITLAGTMPDPGYRLRAAGRTLEARLRYDYMRPGRESWFELLPTLVYRSTLAKSDLVRHWAWIGALAFMLLAGWLAVAAVLRERSS